MVKVVNGDILNSQEDIIIHQVNIQGIMGGGVARQLSNKYIGLEDNYRKYCINNKNDYLELSGIVYFYNDYSKIIANMFSQMPNFSTDYIAMKKGLFMIKQFAQYNKLSIAIPYGIGCGIANGDWNEVYKIIEYIFNDYDVVLYRLEG